MFPFFIHTASLQRFSIPFCVYEKEWNCRWCIHDTLFVVSRVYLSDKTTTRLLLMSLFLSFVCVVFDNWSLDNREIYILPFFMQNRGSVEDQERREREGLLGRHEGNMCGKNVWETRMSEWHRREALTEGNSLTGFSFLPKRHLLWDEKQAVLVLVCLPLHLFQPLFSLVSLSVLFLLHAIFLPPSLIIFSRFFLHENWILVSGCDLFDSHHPLDPSFTLLSCSFRFHCWLPPDFSSSFPSTSSSFPLFGVFSSWSRFCLFSSSFKCILSPASGSAHLPYAWIPLYCLQSALFSCQNFISLLLLLLMLSSRMICLPLDFLCLSSTMMLSEPQALDSMNVQVGRWRRTGIEMKYSSTSSD